MTLQSNNVYFNFWPTELVSIQLIPANTIFPQHLTPIPSHLHVIQTEWEHLPIFISCFPPVDIILFQYDILLASLQSEVMCFCCLEIIHCYNYFFTIIFFFRRNRWRRPSLSKKVTFESSLIYLKLIRQLNNKTLKGSHIAIEQH